MKQTALRSWAILVMCLMTRFGSAQQPPKPAPEQLVYANEQVTYTPGFAYGNVGIADPAIADFRVLAGRREILLLGKGQGRTTLTVWDQQGVKRVEMLVRVTTREAAGIERELRELLRDFPSARLAPLAGSFVVAGEVSSERDLEAINAIATAANVKSVVRYVPPVLVDTPGTAAPTKPAEITPPPPPMSPLGIAKYSGVEFDIQIIEASASFSSGSYGQGVQPAGQTLVARRVQAQFGTPLQVEIIDPVLVQKLKNNKSSGVKGLHVTFTTAPPDEHGTFTSDIELETNLPIETKLYDPALWRKARWQIPMVSGEPLGIAGADLLAMKSDDRDGKSIWSKLQTTAGVASGFGVPGASYGTVYYYDPVKKTQLLMLIRPRLISRSAG